MARMARSILMPPDVEPEQPQMREQIMSRAMLRGGHSVVSCVAKPVVVAMEATWKAASRSASAQERYGPLSIRSADIRTTVRASSDRKIRMVSDLQR